MPVPNQTFGSLTVIEKTNRQDKNGAFFYLCLCICGKQKEIRGSHLNAGLVKSCGCSHRLDAKAVSYNQIERQYKVGAQRRKLEYQLSRTEFEYLITQHCHYCGFTGRMFNYYLKKDKTRYKKYKADESWIDLQWIKINGIDRLDNSVGYVLYNCVTCCQQCNYAKRNFTYSEFKEYINRLMNYNLVLPPPKA